MKWLTEPATKDFLQGLMCGVIITATLMIVISSIGVRANG